MHLKNVFFGGLETTLAERGILQQAGFVHVTGLPVATSPTYGRSVIGEGMTEDDRGRWDRSHGKLVVVTPGAEVWRRDITSPDEEPSVEILISFCPNCRGVTLPLYTAHIPPRVLRLRETNPDSGITYLRKPSA
jgi:hypothetical protein